MSSLNYEQELLNPYNRSNISRWTIECTNLKESIKHAWKPFRITQEIKLAKFEILIEQANLFLTRLARSPSLMVDDANNNIDIFIEDYEYRPSDTPRTCYPERIEKIETGPLTFQNRVKRGCFDDA